MNTLDKLRSLSQPIKPYNNLITFLNKQILNDLIEILLVILIVSFH